MCDDITCEDLHLRSNIGMDDITCENLKFDDLNPDVFEIVVLELMI